MYMLKYATTLHATTWCDTTYLSLHAKNAQCDENYVWQKFGVSTDYNTFVQHPWHGTGQGATKVAL